MKKSELHKLGYSKTKDEKIDQCFLDWFDEEYKESDNKVKFNNLPECVSIPLHFLVSELKNNHHGMINGEYSRIYIGKESFFFEFEVVFGDPSVDYQGKIFINRKNKTINMLYIEL